MQQHVHQDRLTLSFLPGLGCTLIHRLLEVFDSPTDILAASADRLAQVGGLRSKLIHLLSNRAAIDQARQRAIRELQALEEQNITLICPGDPEYPVSLKAIVDAPHLLYTKGDITLLEQPAVAIVGSRAASAYGKRVSHELARELSSRGVCVVSGMALGIDGEAHAGALSTNGSTIGVLGCGIDVVYPRQHEKLFKEVCGRGLLISEYPLGSRPDGFRFPERNRIISGLVQGIVVVEASLKSGSLITARLALEHGREVFAVPGRIDSSKSRGAHRLLQQGAKLVQDVEDILEELRLHSGVDSAAAGDTMGPAPPIVSDREQHLLDFLDVYPVTIDELVRQSGHGTGDVFDLLLSLELKGMVRQLPGQQYERMQ